jgi:hypothetical protein
LYSRRRAEGQLLSSQPTSPSVQQLGSATLCILSCCLQELARTMQDDAEAARLLASGGDYLAAAERCLQSKKFLERATLGQLLQLHGWLLRVGTTHAASLAVDLWDEQIAAGRLQTDYIEAQAAARLALGRGLLREAVGAAAPVLSVKQQGAAEQFTADGQQQGKHGKGKKKHKGEASYAKAAAKAAAAAAAPRTPQPAPLPTASLAGLHQQLLQPQPETGSADAAQLVRRAVSVLSDAQQGFITANQPAGVLEALSWGLAAKPPEEITVGQWQLSGAGSSSRLCDALEVVGHTQQTVALLQALASTVSSTVVRGERRCCLTLGLWLVVYCSHTAEAQDYSLLCPEQNIQSYWPSHNKSRGCCCCCRPGRSDGRRPPAADKGPHQPAAQVTGALLWDQALGRQHAADAAAPCLQVRAQAFLLTRQSLCACCAGAFAQVHQKAISLCKQSYCRVDFEPGSTDTGWACLPLSCWLTC